MSVLKVLTHIINSIAAGPIGWGAILLIMSVLTQNCCYYLFTSHVYVGLSSLVYMWCRYFWTEVTILFDLKSTVFAHL